MHALMKRHILSYDAAYFHTILCLNHHILFNILSDIITSSLDNKAYMATISTVVVNLYS